MLRDSQSDPRPSCRAQGIAAHADSLYGQAAAKLQYLAIRNIEREWKAAPIQWRQALNQLDIVFGDRLQTVSY